MKTIKLDTGDFIEVDDADYEVLSGVNWKLHKTTGYAVALIPMHRLLMDFPKGKLIDHKDRNKLNNQRANLREATHEQNQANRKIQKNNKTGYMGVSCKDRYGYFASIRSKGKTKFIGYFKNPLHAAMAYDMAAKELRGEFANLNFPLALNN